MKRIIFSESDLLHIWQKVEDMDSEVLVTIGLLVYNHEAYIEDCLKSLLQQDYSNVELIILDDASTDRTRERINALHGELQAKFPKVKLIYHEKNCGNIPHNVNELVRHATGVYYRHAAGDDIMSPNCISSMAKCLQKHPGVSVVYANGYIINDSFKLGDPTGRKRLLPRKPVNDTCENTFRKLMLENWIPSPCAMFRRRIFDEYGLYDESIPYEDYEYWLRISRTEKIHYLDQELVYYRRSENSLSNYFGKNAKRKIKTSMMSDQMTIQKYLHCLSVEDRKKTVDAYYDKYYRMSYSANFYRGFFAAAYKYKKNNPKVNLDFRSMLLNMILHSINGARW